MAKDRHHPTPDNDERKSNVSDDDDAIVYEQTLDAGQFRMKITRTGDYNAQLVVTVESSGEVLLDEPTTLAYRAIFGPDVDDVHHWQEQTVAAVDEYLVRVGQVPPTAP